MKALLSGDVMFAKIALIKILEVRCSSPFDTICRPSKRNGQGKILMG
jgi:hypothetical protein